MKKLVVICFIIGFLFVGYGFAASNSDSNQHGPAIKLVQVFKLKQHYTKSIKRIREQILKRYPAAKKHPGFVSNVLNKYLTWKNIESANIQAMEETYTPQQLKEMLKFYQTPFGKMLARKSYEIKARREKLIDNCLQQYRSNMNRDMQEYFLAKNKRKAKSGDAKYQYILGNYYAGSRKNNKEKKLALYWLNKAAKKGVVPAINDLAVMYAQGVGVKKDVVRANQLYLKGAKLGDGVAMCNLGLHYFYGAGVKQDYKKAYYWFNQAFINNETNSRYMLGLMYAKGIGVTKNTQKANDYLRMLAHEYYDSHFDPADLGAIKHYIDAFVKYQMAQFLDKSPNYSKNTSINMISRAKSVSAHIKKICSVDNVTGVPE